MSKDGYKAESFRGVPIAVEVHADGSVTLAKEVIEEVERALGHAPEMPDLKALRSILEQIANA